MADDNASMDVRTEPFGDLRFWTAPTAPWPGLHAAVTTRAGGVSTAGYASLNLGLNTGDDRTRVGRNRQRVREALGVSAALPLLDQVHGTRVVEARDVGDACSADGAWCADPGCVLVVSIADCVPVFLWDAASTKRALLHAGWRGTADGIVTRGVQSLLAAGSRGADLWMAMGPSIGPCCYEVGSEVRERFADLRPGNNGRTHLDLWDANRRTALASGVRAEHILPDPPCTACHTEVFFSHRRHGPHTGRMWALLWREPPLHSRPRRS